MLSMEMSITTIVELISQLGFPVLTCILCFWYINKKDESHKEEMNKMSEAINNNTVIMQKIYERLDLIEQK